MEVKLLKVNIIYPYPEKDAQLRRKLILALKWPFLFAAYLCPIINLVTRGRAWSVIVLWSLWIVWSAAVSPALVEYNRISQFIKLIVNACILLILIDLLLSPGWAVEVVAIVCFSGLVVSGLLFFTDLERQKQNMLPMLLLTVICMIGAVVGLILWHGESRWALAMMGAFAFALLAGCFFVLGPDFKRELAKRFHTN